MDDTGSIVFANAAAERILGRPRADIIGRAVDDPIWNAKTLDGRPFPAGQQPFRQVMAAGEPVEGIEQVLEHPSGHRTIVSISATPLLDASDAVTGCITSFRDITSAHEEEAALHPSEARYRHLMEVAPDMIYSIAQTGEITELNPAFTTVTGWDADEWIGKPFSDIIHPEDRPRAHDLFAEIINGKRLPPSELRILTRWGDYRVGEFRSAPQHDQGRVTGIFGIARDITTRKRWEVERRRQADEFRILADNVPDIIARLDRDFRLLYVNPAIETIVRRPARSVIGKTTAEIGIPPDLAAWWNAAVQRVFDDGKEYNLEFDYGPLGDTRSYHARIVPESRHDSEIRHVLAIIRDITHHEAAERRFRLLADASALLASSLDRRASLPNLANLIVPRFADWCGIDLFMTDGEIAQIALVHRDLDKQTLLEDLWEQYPALKNPSHPMAETLRNAETVAQIEWSESTLLQIAEDEVHLRMLRELAPASSIVAPLIVRGAVIGAMSLGVAAPRASYAPDDITLAEELAARTAQAIDNARLYELSQEAEHQARQQSNRLRALSDAARTFAEATLDFQTVLDTVAKTAATEFAGLCVIRLISADGAWLKPAGVYHPNPEAVALITELIHQSPARVDEGVAGRVVETGQAFILPRVGPGDLYHYIKPEYWPFYERFGLRSMMVVPLQARGRMIGTLGVFRNTSDHPITAEDQTFLHHLADRAALAVDNAALYQQAEAAVRAREEFISIASHELKTPLTTIRGYNQILLRQLHRPNVDLERTRSIATHLWEQTARLEALVTDLLDSSRIQQGRLSLRPEHFNLATLVRQVLDRFEYAPERQPTHQLELDAPGPVMVTWDPNRIDQVLMNLISNALKYSPEGGRVCVRVQRLGDDVELRVEDYGIGISAEDQAMLFQPFSRAGGIRRDVTGTGLGLYISAQIVERHGGTITLESEPNHGSTFIVRLPITVAD